MALREYEAGRAFPGVIGRTMDESSPAWPRQLRAEPRSPNVLFTLHTVTVDLSAGLITDTEAEMRMAMSHQ